VVCLLVLVRFTHMQERIDGKHIWRECETGFFAYDFYANGINLLKPSVCWLGPHRTLILEFPLPEALMALAYHALGFRHLWARLLTLGFFLGATFYLYRIVAHVRSTRAAKLAAAVYLALPLGLAYSRAVHPDFYAVFFAHAMLYYLLRGYDDERTGLIALGTAFGVVAFLIKCCAT